MGAKSCNMSLAAISLIALMIATCSAKCFVPEPTLVELHSGCNTVARSRHQDCVAAIHRYCEKMSDPCITYPIGISREHTDSVVGISCIAAEWAGKVLISELSEIKPECQQIESQNRNCLAAIHRYCKNRLGNDYAGLSQEAEIGKFFVGCFKSTLKENVPFSTMTELHPDCQFPANSDGPQCFAAASRFCVQKGFSGGVTQEVGESEVYVACYNGVINTDVPIQRDE